MMVMRKRTLIWLLLLVSRPAPRAFGDADPGNLIYRGLWHHLFKVPNYDSTRFEYREGGIDYTDEVSPLVNFLNMDNEWMKQLAEEAAEEWTPDCIPAGYGLESYARRCIDEKGEMLVLQPGYQGKYHGTKTWIIPYSHAFRLLDENGRTRGFVPWSELTADQRWIVKERFKLMWTGWDGTVGCFPTSTGQAPVFGGADEFRSTERFDGLGARCGAFFEHIAFISNVDEPYIHFPDIGWVEALQDSVRQAAAMGVAPAAA